VGIPKGTTIYRHAKGKLHAKQRVVKKILDKIPESI
jgi:hypothetical protein